MIKLINVSCYNYEFYQAVGKSELKQRLEKLDPGDQHVR